MNILWAPWRVRYVSKSEKEKKCLFCSVIKSKNDKKNLIIERGKHSFVILNKFPYNNGHLMIVPYSHSPDFNNLKENELLELMYFVQKYCKILKKVFKCHGFNIGVNIGKPAGAGIEEHVHIHIVPRWNGDTNFMPVVGKTKVIPESLESVYSKLKNQIKNEK